MKTVPALVRHLLAAAVSFSTVLHFDSRADSIGVRFDLQFNTYQAEPHFNGFVAFPLLAVDPVRPTLTKLSSPNGDFSTELGAFQAFGGASSTVFPDFISFTDTLNAPEWTLTTDADTGSPTGYLFDVDASALSDWTDVLAVLAPGLQGAVYPAGSSPTFTWTGPLDFDRVSISLFAPGFAGEFDDLPPTATSYTTNASLLPGEYQFNVSYSLDVSSLPPLSVTVPSDSDSGDPLPDWSGLEGVTLRVQDRITFSVVPEPGTASLLMLAGLGILVRRQRRTV